MNVRKVFSVVIVMVFFLTSIPGYANQSAPPVTYEQVMVQELLRELKLDLDSLQGDQSESYSLRNAQRDSVLSEFDDVKEYLTSIPYAEWTQETVQKALMMIADRMDENKAKEYAEKIGLTPKAISLIESLTGLDKLKNNPEKCAMAVAFVVCVVVGIFVAIAYLTIFLINPVSAVYSIWESTVLIGIISIVISTLTAHFALKMCVKNDADYD